MIRMIPRRAGNVKQNLEVTHLILRQRGVPIDNGLSGIVGGREMTIFWFNLNFAGKSVKHGMLIKSFRGSVRKIDTATWTAVTGL